MSYGFEAFDAGGRLLLSDVVGSYGYKGTFTATANTAYTDVLTCGATSWELAMINGSGNWVVQIPKAQFPSPPLVMFELPTYPNGCGLAGLVEYSTGWEALFLSTVQPVVHAFGLFTNEARSTVGMGLQVFDSNGLLTFDSLKRRPLQLLQPPISFTQAPFSRTLYDSATHVYSTVTAMNNTVISPSITLPSTVLMSGTAIWDYLCEPDYFSTSKVLPGSMIEMHWRMYGRDGNNIRFFGYRAANCPEYGSSGWMYPFIDPKTFNGRLMIADKALYT